MNVNKVNINKSFYFEVKITSLILKLLVESMKRNFYCLY